MGVKTLDQPEERLLELVENVDGFAEVKNFVLFLNFLKLNIIPRYSRRTSLILLPCTKREVISQA